MRLLELIGGIWELTRLGVVSRFRFSGSYWTWRLHTAFGRGTPSRGALFHAVLDYGAWIFRMRRGR
jgi:hypothetical protein